jgi:hypothetical protein
MELKGEAKLLRIFVGESDKIHHVALFEVIVREARQAGLAGATAWRGLLGYGHDSRIRSAKIMDLSADLSIIIEIADSAEKIEAFLPRLRDLIELADSGGLVTLERVEILLYRRSKP